MATQTTKLATTPLYGVLFTSKSYLLGLRHLIDAEHARFLAYRTAGARLPTEIVDQIVGHVLELYDKDASRVVRKHKGRKSRVDAFKFGLESPTKTPAELRARINLDMVSKGLRIGWIQLQKPGGGEEDFMHISADERKSSVALILPGSVPATGGPPVELDGGRVKVKCYTPFWDDKISLAEVQVSCVGGNPVASLLQVDDIEETVKNWDPTAVERLVEGLKLEPVRVQGEEGDPLKPRLRIWQMIS